MNWNMKYESNMDFDQNHKTWLIIYTFLKGTNLIDNNTALFLWSCSAVVIVGHWRRVLRKREVYVGNVEGWAFLPTSIFHQISSPSYPNYQLQYHFFLEKAMAHIEPLLTLWGKERCIWEKWRTELSSPAVIREPPQTSQLALTFSAREFQYIPSHSSYITTVHHMMSASHLNQITLNE